MKLCLNLIYTMRISFHFDENFTEMSKEEENYLGDKLKSLSRREVAFLPKALTPALEIPRSRVKSREMPLMDASGIDE